MLGHQTSLKALQRIEIIQMIFSDYNRIKLKLKIEKKSEKSQISGKTIISK